MKEKISLKNVNKFYGSKRVLTNISFSVNEGELVTVIGPSGSGKSTLIRCLNLLEIPTNGRLLFNNNEINYITNKFGNLTFKSELSLSKYRTKVGMVFQQFNLFPNRTVIENLIDGPHRILHLSTNKCIRNAEKYLDLVGLMEHKDKYPAQLSGGQKQRVAIARAMMMSPEVLLFDEPTSALDPEMVNDVLKVMMNLKKTGITMVVVTHEMAFTEQASDKVVFLEGGEIKFSDTPQKLQKISTESRVSKFIRTLDHRIIV